jgi:hypothetical protein
VLLVLGFVEVDGPQEGHLEVGIEEGKETQRSLGMSEGLKMEMRLLGPSMRMTAMEKRPLGAPALLGSQGVHMEPWGGMDNHPVEEQLVFGGAIATKEAALRSLSRRGEWTDNQETVMEVFRSRQLVLTSLDGVDDQEVVVHGDGDGSTTSFTPQHLRQRTDSQRPIDGSRRVVEVVLRLGLLLELRDLGT